MGWSGLVWSYLIWSGVSELSVQVERFCKPAKTFALPSEKCIAKVLLPNIKCNINLLLLTFNIITWENCQAGASL